MNKSILAVCSTLDFRNYTRRATFEAIAKKTGRLDVLLFTGIKNRFTEKKSVDHLRTLSHHFWVPDVLKEKPLFGDIEHTLRKPIWKKRFSEYDVIFFSDPNQYWLLFYMGNQTVVYLIRDPNILQSEKHRTGEQKLLEHADLVLATSRNLAENYLPNYYGFQHDYIRYWPNCADLNLWDISKLNFKKAEKATVGVAGNFSEKRTDYELLEYIAVEMPNVQFEIAGKIDRVAQPEFWNRMLEKENVTYIGFIPLDELPEKVEQWHVGLVTDRMDEYASYMHHNKVYQYLSMGLPVVSMRIHEDYGDMEPCVLTAGTHEEFVNAVRRGIKNSTSETFREHCRKLSEENSAEKRAEVFMEYVKDSF